MVKKKAVETAVETVAGAVDALGNLFGNFSLGSGINYGKPRKGWADLSQAYQKRMGKGGLNAKNWATPEGARLRQAARGHGETPERPERALKNPKRYRKYLEESTSLVDKVIAHKELLWGNTFKYRVKGSINAVLNPKTKDRTVDGKHVKSRSIKLNRAAARQFLKMTLTDLDELDGDWWEDDKWCFLFYH